VTLIILILIFTLFVSTIFSVITLRKQNRKQVSLLVALCINTLVLVVATMLWYKLDDETRLFGFGHSALYVLVFSIPIVTWFNFLILEFVNKRKLT
jgi:hypothetical protein